jgi:hypothetical protein
MSDSESGDMWGRATGILVPFGWKPWCNKYLSRERKQRAALISGLFHLLLYTFNQSGWILDEIFYRRWRTARVESPVFILGHQRSGTTYLHRLLASDNNTLPLTLQEMLIPAVSLQKLFAVFRKWDERTGHKIKELLDRKQAQMLKDIDSIHRIRLDEIEEDEFVFWAIFASGMCAHDSSAAGSNPKLSFLRSFENWPMKRQAAVLNYYRSCLMKKFFREGAAEGNRTGWILSKNPAFGQKIPWLLKVFPDARFICLVRNPLEAIPSRLALIQAIWTQRLQGEAGLDRSAVNALVQDSIRTYLFTEMGLGEVSFDRKIIITHERLCRHPRDCVMEIYRRLNLPKPQENFMEKINELLPYETGGLGMRERSEQFGIDKKMILRKLESIFEKYDFPVG